MSKLFKNETNLNYDAAITLFGLEENASLSLDYFYRVLELLDTSEPLTETAIKHKLKPRIRGTTLPTVIWQLRAKELIELAYITYKKRRSKYRKVVNLSDIYQHYKITDKGRQRLRDQQELYEFPPPDIEQEPNVIA